MHATPIGASSGVMCRKLVARSAIFWPRADVAATAVEVSTSSRSSTDRLMFDGDERHCDRESRTIAYGACDRDRAAVALHGLPRAGQADARPADATFDVARALEALEDATQLGGGDTHAFVLHLQTYPILSRS